MMRLNRVFHLMRWHAEHGTGWFDRPYKVNTYTPAKWFRKHGLIEEGEEPHKNCFGLRPIRVTEKGAESLKRAIAEHEAHGSFRPAER